MTKGIKNEKFPINDNIYVLTGGETICCIGVVRYTDEIFLFFGTLISLFLLFFIFSENS